MVISDVMAYGCMKGFDKEEQQDTRLNALLGSNYINMYYICGYIHGAFRNQLQIIYF